MYRTSHRIGRVNGRSDQSVARVHKLKSLYHFLGVLIRCYACKNQIRSTWDIGGGGGGERCWKEETQKAVKEKKVTNFQELKCVS